jgi:hypothetical protein
VRGKDSRDVFGAGRDRSIDLVEVDGEELGDIGAESDSHVFIGVHRSEREV